MDYKIVLDERLCKKCLICAEICPSKALRKSKVSSLSIDDKKCTGCRLCELYCPDFAVTHVARA